MYYCFKLYCNKFLKIALIQTDDNWFWNAISQLVCKGWRGSQNTEVISNQTKDQRWKYDTYIYTHRYKHNTKLRGNISIDVSKFRFHVTQKLLQMFFHALKIQLIKGFLCVWLITKFLLLQPNSTMKVCNWKLIHFIFFAE